MLTVTGSKTPIALSDIIYLKADDNYTWFYLTNGKRMLSSLPLSHYSSIATGFVRIHKSYLVNPEHIRGFDRPTKRIAGSVEVTSGAVLSIAYARWVSVRPLLRELTHQCKLQAVL